VPVPFRSSTSRDMSGTLSKRQQARNEKALQDLVVSVPGNNFCADCQARNPCTQLIPTLEAVRLCC